MARIEPIPWEALPEAARRRIVEGLDSGMYTNPLPMQIIAYSSAALQSMDEMYHATFRRGLLEPRLVELVRLRSAQDGACEPCSASRKDASVSEADVAGLREPGADRFTDRELAALGYFERLAHAPESIDDAFFADLAVLFSIAEIVELGWLCATCVGGHRFIHSLGVLSDSKPVLAWDPAQIDSSARAPDPRD